MITLRKFSIVVVLCFSTLSPRSDEGMWLFNQPPTSQIRDRYGFVLTERWLDHVRESSVRFNSGGSGSFVSEDGLLISNHHVGADALQKLSTAEKNLLRDGFYARSLSEEIKCVDLELNVLQSIEDVTDRMNQAVPPGATGAEAFTARRRVQASIEKESIDKTGLRSDVVTLFQGGKYHLYRFKKYIDVRLVFAPEQQIAFFGGDPDNFEFPRYNLDVCLFRAYENGQPVKVNHYLKWSKNGAQPGELTFVSGHPGRTSRLLTVAELEYLRDVSFPYLLGRLKRNEVLLNSWSERSAENARRAKDDLFGIQNSRKARDGGHAGLYDPRIMKAKIQGEAQLKEMLKGKPEFAEALEAFTKIANAQVGLGSIAPRHRMLESGHGFFSDSFVIARRILRAVAERSKPNGERLTEYQEAARSSFELDLFSDKPIYEDLEILTLSDSLTLLAEQLGFQDPTVKAVLVGKSPRQRASELISQTKVRDVAVRQKWYAMDDATLKQQNDPMIELARMIDEEARLYRREAEAYDEVKRQSHSAIAKARVALQGTGGYPDATFTLRLSYGVVMGYEDQGKTVPAQTTLQGLYDRANEMNQRSPFDLPSRWLQRKSALDLDTPFNFVGTHDIIGGNSGSPVINQNAEFVGIIFDGNIQSLALDFAYEDQKARSLSVHSSAILEALNRAYDATPLAEELVSGKRSETSTTSPTDVSDEKKTSPARNKLRKNPSTGVPTLRRSSP